MEKWSVFDKNIYFEDYFESEIIFSDDDILKIILFDDKKRIKVDFGWILGFRVLDEGIVQNGVYYNMDELKRLKEKHFCNVIYILEDGEFGDFIVETASGFWEKSQIKHLAVITPNYNIDIVTNHLPDVEEEILAEQ